MNTRLALIGLISLIPFAAAPAAASSYPFFVALQPQSAFGKAFWA